MDNATEPHGLATVSEAGKAPKERLDSGNKRRELAANLIRTDRVRNKADARIKGMIDGNPAYNSDKLRKHAQSWRDNTNYLEGKAAHSAAMVPYYDLLSGASAYANVRLKLEDLTVSLNKSQIASEEWKMPSASDRTSSVRPRTSRRMSSRTASSFPEGPNVSVSRWSSCFIIFLFQIAYASRQTHEPLFKMSGVIRLSAASSSVYVFRQSSTRATLVAVCGYRCGTDTDTTGTPSTDFWMAPAFVPPPPGCRTWNGILDCLAAVERASGWRERRGKLPHRRGLGVASSTYIRGTVYPI